MILTQRFDSALLFAADKHRDQRRKGGDIPYVSHLLQIAGLVLENGGSEDEAIAGLLHDVMEDQDVTHGELVERFGANVADIVASCSDSVSSIKGPWKMRKLAYIAHVKEATPSARLVSSCDKLHNARAILADYQELGEGVWTRFNAPSSDTLWYYDELAQAYDKAAERACEPKSRIVRQLQGVVAELSELAKSTRATV